MATWSVVVRGLTESGDAINLGVLDNCIIEVLERAGFEVMLVLPRFDEARISAGFEAKMRWCSICHWI